MAGKPNPRVTNGHRRRQARARLIATATHTTCPWPQCPWPGQTFDPNLDHNNPRFPEVDEIIPISKGGSPLKADNLRLLHRHCNQRRGNRPDPAPMARPKPITTSQPW